jgi:hypothetical protein
MFSIGTLLISYPAITLSLILGKGGALFSIFANPMLFFKDIFQETYTYILAAVQRTTKAFLTLSNSVKPVDWRSDMQNKIGSIWRGAFGFGSKFICSTSGILLLSGVVFTYTYAHHPQLLEPF